MPLKVTNEGDVRLLDILNAGIGLGALRLRLFKNNITPVEGSVYGDFEEADFKGYSQAIPSFGAASLVSGKGKITDTVARTFAYNSGSSGSASNTIYGYYMVDATTSKCLWAETFKDIDGNPAPQTISADGQTITVTAALTFNTES